LLIGDQQLVAWELASEPREFPERGKLHLELEGCDALDLVTQIRTSFASQANDACVTRSANVQTYGDPATYGGFAPFSASTALTA
jgi:hypothetical protein